MRTAAPFEKTKNPRAHAARAVEAKILGVQQHHSLIFFSELSALSRPILWKRQSAREFFLYADDWRIKFLKLPPEKNAALNNTASDLAAGESAAQKNGNPRRRGRSTFHCQRVRCRCTQALWVRSPASLSVRPAAQPAARRMRFRLADY